MTIICRSTEVSCRVYLASLPPESMQRTEAKSHQRNDVPVKRGKARNKVTDSGQEQAGDSSREKGGTQKSLIVHSHDCKILSRNVFNQAKVLAVISALGEEQTHD